MGRVSVFLGLIACALISQQGQAASAYDLLRSQFHQAQAPLPDQVMIGENWFCSGSLKAAKGLFRYVDYWEAGYVFEKTKQARAVRNTGPEGVDFYHFFSYALKGSKQTCGSCDTHWSEFVRVNRDGDLLVEIVEPRQEKSLAFWRKTSSRGRSIVDPGYEAKLYLVCENPMDHDDSRWFEGDYWSVPGKKSVQDPRMAPGSQTLGAFSGLSPGSGE